MNQNTLLVIVLGVIGLVAAAIFLIPAPTVEPPLAAAASDQVPASTTPGLPAALAPETSVQSTSVSAIDPGEVAPMGSGLAAPAGASLTHRVIATYFHNTARCVTCRNIENRSKEAIEAAFADELASGQLTWRAVNMEQKENEHYAIDYDLAYASLVLAETDGEREVRFKVLEQTWDLVHKRQPLLEDYVVSETRAFLEGR